MSHRCRLYNGERQNYQKQKHSDFRVRQLRSAPGTPELDPIKLALNEWPSRRGVGRRETAAGPER